MYVYVYVCIYIYLCMHVYSEDCFYYCSERNNVVVLFGTLKVHYIYEYVYMYMYMYIYESICIFAENMHAFTGVVEHHACAGVNVRQML